MYSTKYIVVKTPMTDEIIIFGDTIAHNEVARRMRLDREQILSAGFLSICIENTRPRSPSFGVEGDDKGEDFVSVTAYGKSVSLGIESREKEDTLLATRALGLNRW